MISKTELVGLWKFVKTDRKRKYSEYEALLCEFTDDLKFFWLKPRKASLGYQIEDERLFFIFRGGAKSHPYTLSRDGNLLKVTAIDGKSDWLERLPRSNEAILP